LGNWDVVGATSLPTGRQASRDNTKIFNLKSVICTISVNLRPKN